MAIPFSIFALAEVARPAVVLAKATALGLIVPDLVVRLAFEDWLDLEAKATALGLIVPDLVVRLAFEDWLDLEVVVDLVLLDLLLSVGFEVSVLLSVSSVFELLPPLLSLLLLSLL